MLDIKNLCCKMPMNCFLTPFNFIAQFFTFFKLISMVVQLFKCFTWYLWQTYNKIVLSTINHPVLWPVICSLSGGGKNICEWEEGKKAFLILSEKVRRGQGFVSASTLCILVRGNDEQCQRGSNWTDGLQACPWVFSIAESANWNSVAY